MADRLEFKQKLGGILELAKQQNKDISIEEVEQYFEEDILSKEQIDLVCEYLMAQNIRVKGYTKMGGKIIESTQESQGISEDEKTYLSGYLKDLEQTKESDERLFYYLKKTVEHAKRLYNPEIFLGDLIQEGNLSLMIALKEYDSSTEEEQIMEAVKQGMEVLIASQTEQKNKDKQIVERVEGLEETIRKVSEDLGREVSVEELAIHLDMKTDEIEELLKLESEAADL